MVFQQSTIKMYGASVVNDSSARQLMFNIQVTRNLEVKEVPKSEILKAVNSAFFMGLSNIDDVLSPVVDFKKLEIFSKLYVMKMAEKLEAWIQRYHEYMKLMTRSESEKRQLIDEYNTIVMGVDKDEVDSKLYAQANEYASKLLLTHV
jgi:hypothetical protein